MTPVQEVISRGVANIIPDKVSLEKALNSKKLNIYLGIDPTATHIHLGHAVLLRKLQKFAELGHNVTFLIGDFTALIGDTSDKEGERPALTPEEIKANFKDYKKQAEKVLDFSKITVRNNSEWLSKLTFEDIIKLTQMFSLGDFVSRELIRKRMEKGTRVGLHEVLYPVMQGYDSAHMDTDLQIGGTDQTFNMQAGRQLQKALSDKDSFVLTTDFLMGIDGRKMSKSWGNAIWLDDSPEDMYRKAMQVNDELIRDYFILATDIHMDEIEKMNITKDPLKYKKELAFTIVSEFYSSEKAQQAAAAFEKVVQKGELPDNIPTFEVSDVRAENTSLPHLLHDAGVVASVSAGRRLIKQGGVEVDDKKTDEQNIEISDGTIIRAGKKKAFRVKVYTRDSK